MKDKINIVHSEIEMDYPFSQTNTSYDGRTHRIEPTGLYVRNINGRNIYVLLYNDMTLGRYNMVTLLERVGNRFVKIPLEKYDERANEFIASIISSGENITGDISQLSSHIDCRNITNINYYLELLQRKEKTDEEKPIKAAAEALAKILVYVDLNGRWFISTNTDLSVFGNERKDVSYLPLEDTTFKESSYHLLTEIEKEYVKKNFVVEEVSVKNITLYHGKMFLDQDKEYEALEVRDASRIFNKGLDKKRIPNHVAAKEKKCLINGNYYIIDEVEKRFLDKYYCQRTELLEAFIRNLRVVECENFYYISVPAFNKLPFSSNNRIVEEFLNSKDKFVRITVEEYKYLEERFNLYYEKGIKKSKFAEMRDEPSKDDHFELPLHGSAFIPLKDHPVIVKNTEVKNESEKHSEESVDLSGLNYEEEKEKILASKHLSDDEKNKLISELNDLFGIRVR